MEGEEMIALMTAALLALQTPSPGQPDLDWMAGYWLQCEGDREVAELWTTRRGGVLLGMSVTEGRQAFGFEQVRIETTYDGATMQYVARPRGAEAETVFRMSRAGPREAVFDNPAHDYPQRIAYRREGDVLIARTEGANGADRQEWRYRLAALNERCPVAGRRR
jgi:hypothetical protein